MRFLEAFFFKWSDGKWGPKLGLNKKSGCHSDECLDGGGSRVFSVRELMVAVVGRTGGGDEERQAGRLTDGGRVATAHNFCQMPCELKRKS